MAFIGSVGIPNRYGGFEAFLEHVAPRIAQLVGEVRVTCDASRYESHETEFMGVRRVFIPVRANGAASMWHDFVAFCAVLSQSSHVFVLGVSAGPLFPVMRLLSVVRGCRLIVNIDGVEWRRQKYGNARRALLRAFDWLAQVSADVIIYDNAALEEFVIPSARRKAIMIPYSGDHVVRRADLVMMRQTALTICRIEPENSIEMLIDGFLASRLERYTIVGNWSSSAYGVKLHQKYAAESRLVMLDPIYDAGKLAELREQCGFYLHGHSVGGTNPSLVEMLFYDCRILCFDVSFNRMTAGDASEYFATTAQLTAALASQATPQMLARFELRRRYTGDAIAASYCEATVV